MKTLLASTLLAAHALFACSGAVEPPVAPEPVPVAEDAATPDVAPPRANVPGYAKAPVRCQRTPSTDSLCANDAGRPVDAYWCDWQDRSGPAYGECGTGPVYVSATVAVWCCR